MRLCAVFNMAYNVGSYTQDGILPDELPTKSCLLKFKFPVNEPPKPGLRVAEVVGSVFRSLETLLFFVFFISVK